jgi:hypothetical protein
MDDAGRRSFHALSGDHCCNAIRVVFSLQIVAREPIGFSYLFSLVGLPANQINQINQMNTHPATLR